MENNTSYIVAGVVVVALVIIGYVMYTRSNTTPAALPMATTTAPEVMPLTLDAKHLYSDGAHVYRGIVQTPTPCYDVTAVASPTSEYNVYSIAITSKERAGACAQQIVDKEFEVSFKAPVDAPVLAFLNGKPVKLNVLEVETREDLLGPFDFKS